MAAFILSKSKVRLKGEEKRRRLLTPTIFKYKSMIIPKIFK